MVSRFNSFITDRLLAGALDALEAAGADAENIKVVHVPGSFEIPLTAKKLAEGGRVDAVIAIGCILRGETAHFDYVASEVARGVQLAQLDTGVPVIFCVLTCDTLEQAIDRAGLKSGNKGYDAGLAAVEMANLSKQLRPAASIARRQEPLPAGNAARCPCAGNPASTPCRCCSNGKWGSRSRRESKTVSGKTRAPRNPRANSPTSFLKTPPRAPAELDPIISSHAQNWRIERIAAIDRAILRLALAEMRTTSTPAKVVINEAVELAKKFSSEEAVRRSSTAFSTPPSKSFGEKTQ